MFCLENRLFCLENFISAAVFYSNMDKSHLSKKCLWILV